MATTISDFYRGDSKTIRVSIASAVYNGGTAWLTLKANKDDLDADAVLQKSAPITAGTEPDTGEAAIALTPDDTELEPGRYYYDVQLVSADGGIVTTTLAGKIACKVDITRSVS